MAEYWVVVASRGEYSDRTEWVCGVYASKDEAIGAAEHAMRESNDYRARYDQWHRRLPDTKGMVWPRPKHIEDARAEYVRANPTPVSDFSMDDVTVIGPVPLGVWGDYSGIDMGA